MSIDGKMFNASKFGKEKEKKEALEITDEEKEFVNILNSIWKGILSIQVNENTDFFASGAGSMDVVR